MPDLPSNPGHWGIMVIRLWSEEPGSGVRARLMFVTDDVSDDDPAISAAAGRAGILGAVGDCLEQFGRTD